MHHDHSNCSHSHHQSAIGNLESDHFSLVKTNYDNINEFQKTQGSTLIRFLKKWINVFIMNIIILISEYYNFTVKKFFLYFQSLC